MTELDKLDRCKRSLARERALHKKTVSLLKELILAHTADREDFYPGHPGDELYPKIEKHLRSLESRHD